MAEAAVDLLALADAVLARRSRVHAFTSGEHVNTASHASGLILQSRSLSDSSVNTAGPIVDGNNERAAPAEMRAGVPREWAEGFARLQVSRPPARLPSERWQLVIDDAERFIERWAAQAAALGWRMRIPMISAGRSEAKSATDSDRCRPGIPIEAGRGGERS